MNTFTIGLMSLFSFLYTTIYSYSFNDMNGNQVDFSSFAGKKILIVNVASASPYADQMQELVQLKQTFSDSLVIVLFPSNSFNNEPRNSAELNSALNSYQQQGIFIAEKSAVAGELLHPVYQWLSSFAENEVMEGRVVGDYQKFLIDEQGLLLAAFSGRVRPLQAVVLDAVRQ